VAYAQDKIGSLPVKAKKTKVRARYFHYFVIEFQNQVYLRKRTGKDIWQNLYEFCLLETDTPLEPEALLNDAVTRHLPVAFPAASATLVQMSRDYKHILTHQHLYARFLHLRLSKKPGAGEGFMAVSKTKLKDFAWPRLMDKYLQEHPFS